MFIAFGLLVGFFALTILVLQLTYKKDKNFTEYAVGGRAFGSAYQLMSFLNTWYPGAMFIAFAALVVTSGAVGFYVLTYSLLTIVVMYLICRRVWMWGKSFDLKTQPDLFALRYNSRHIRTLAGTIGIVSTFPWLVLGMQALGSVFQYLSLGAMTYNEAIVVGVIVLVIRQFWTIRMGMRGVVISDMVQGIAAYIGGSMILIGLIWWMVASKGITFNNTPPRLFDLPGIGSKEGPFYLFSLILTGAVGGWCWPQTFVRLFTADSVKSVKESAAYAMPLSFIFCALLLIFCMLAANLPGVAANPEGVWYIACQQAGGVVLIGLAGVVVFAATVGSVDGGIQACGAQIGNDLVGNYKTLSHKQLLLCSKVGMLVITLLAAWVATIKLPALFMLAVLSYQGVVQLAVPQFIGLFWKRGNKTGASLGMVVGFMTAIVLETHPALINGTGGITSGVIALAVNLCVYVVTAYVLPQSAEERERVEGLFAMTRIGAEPVSGANLDRKEAEVFIV